ncbi:MAG TPA: T9SS type A sorting domain-containing protein, partial [Bacteroidales bacterium]|nr:T9SS type A sorting domain-containing protein [Bacteroidales bacterium]HPS71700.1 T9SS type A sorting domain-containing protein [Bacteroidales bacterium]
VRMIAPFFADLEVINTKTKFQNNELIISYKGKVKNQPESYISFIVILKSDGTIEIHYGEMKYGKTSYISGISNGKNNNLIYSSLNNLPAALIQKKSVRFKPIDHLSHIALTSTGLLSGVSDTQKTDSVLISCFDNNEIKAQKWIYLDFTNPSYLTIKKISFAKSDCNTLQKGSEDFLNIEITNYGDSAYQNIHLSYQINSPFIISPAGNLHLGSFAPLETQNFTQLIHLESTGNAPDNNPIDLQWFLINNQDTISKGIFTFSIKTPEFEVQEYSLTQKQAVYNNYNLDIRLKNLNECNVSDLSFELSISDGSYSISPELNGVQKADQFETVHLLFNIVDQESMLYLSKIQFSIKIYSFGKLIQVENFDFIPNNQYTANPNPTFNYTEISASDPHQIITHAEIYHVSGIRVQSMEVSSTPFILDLSGLVQGVYYVKITSKDQKSSTLKIIKL